MLSEEKKKEMEREFNRGVVAAREDLALVTMPIAVKYGPAVTTTALLDFAALTVKCAPEELQESFAKRFGRALESAGEFVKACQEARGQEPEKHVLGFMAPEKKDLPN